ncbi:DUF397 domain-containing protein [Streptomyces gamaensis]|uniref:DUF397 domain-containing protein n=1 Tax=Streptomyces gamaensis TaxID=1763542 RepID=A0ABW0Z3L2_9ACTN
MPAVCPDGSIAAWRKSSYSNEGPTCLEVADQHPGAVPVRDSKAPARGHLVFGNEAWSRFVTAVTAASGEALQTP